MTCANLRKAAQLNCAKCPIMKIEQEKRNPVERENNYIPFELVESKVTNHSNNETQLLPDDLRESYTSNVRESNAKVTREKSIEIHIDYKLIFRVSLYVIYAIIFAAIGYVIYAIIDAVVTWLLSIDWAYIISLIGRMFFAIVIGVLFMFIARELIQNRRRRQGGRSRDVTHTKSENIIVNQTVIINKK